MSDKTSSYKHMKEQEYKMIKALLDAKVSTTQVVEVTGRSRSLIGVVRQSSDFEDYRARRRAFYETHIKNKPSTQSAPESTKLQPLEEMWVDRSLTILQNINESLGAIDERLKFIEEHLPIEAKRRFF